MFSHVQLFTTPWTTAHQASLSITNSRNLLKLICIESVMPSNHLILCHPLLLPPSIFPSIRVFTNESVLHIRWPKYWSFSFSISPSHEYSGLISFRMDWLDLPAAQGTLKSLLQHHSSKASFLWCSAFFIVQLSYPPMTTGKTITLTRRTFVSKVMSLLFNMLSRLVISFLPRSKHHVKSRECKMTYSGAFFLWMHRHKYLLRWNCLTWSLGLYKEKASPKLSDEFRLPSYCSVCELQLVLVSKGQTSSKYPLYIQSRGGPITPF